jgi:hypothetical protein
LAEQNLLTYSQDYTQSVWTKSGITNTGASTTAPDGTTTGSLIDDGTSTGFHVLQYSVATNGTVTVSGYVKNINRQYVGLIVFGAGGSSTYISAVFDLANTTNTTSQNGSGYSVTSATITSVGNSWYRITLSGIVSSATLMAIYPSNSATAGYVPSYTGTNQQFYLWGAQLEQRSSVTAYNATTTSALTNYIPQLLTAPINAPRFDFNPTTGESLGLLIEQSSTNLLTYSQDFSNAVWTKNNCSITANTWVAPDGTVTGSTITNNSGATNWARARQAVTTSIGTAYTESTYFKAGSTIYASILLTDNTDRAVIFNLSAGTLNILGAGITASITAVGNGVYRCSVTLTSSATTTVYTNIGPASIGSINSLANDYIFAWGAQLEALAFPTSYISTTSAQVTRASDNASMTGTNFSSWWNSSQGTFYTEFDILTTSSLSTRELIGFNGSGNSRFFNGIAWGGASYTACAWGMYAADFVGSSLNLSNGFQKIASSYANGSVTGVANGGTIYTKSGEIPTPTAVYFGADFSATRILNGHFKKIAFYSISFTGSQLQSLTGS